MSKLSQLKQEAYQAGKKRDWGQAVSIYEQILELDKNNPTLINELGDLCLKAGQTPRGVKHFLSAAAKYRHTGLLNNAVAIYKKILRYDSENMNAHWYLAESRANQGLLMEGAQHALVFLGNQDSLSGDIKEIFLKRCSQLFELYPENQEILKSLLQVFRMWNMSQESGRTQIQLACLLWDEDQKDTSERMVQEVLSNTPELANYPEHSRWQERQNPGNRTINSGDFNSISFDDQSAVVITDESGGAQPSSEDSSQDLVKPVPTAPAPVPAAQTPADSQVPEWARTSSSNNDETSFGEVSFDDIAEPGNTGGEAVVEPEADNTLDPFASTPTGETSPAKPDEPELDPDDGGCFNLDMGEDCSFDDLIAQATAGVPAFADEPDPISAEPGSEIELPVDPAGPEEESSSVNLLDELLAEESDTSLHQAAGEVDTISEEIGSQLGGDNSNDDPASLYEMGMVYLEMGMHDQACDSFQKASCHDDFAIRAHEMWGITLLRGGKVDEAIAVLTEGLDVPEEGSREYLGLLYHIARAHEQGGNNGEALRLFEMIHDRDAGFLDVGRRVAKLLTLS